MIPDIGWVELLIIAAVAIIVVGPKDLPRLMRVLGQWVGKARSLAREFQRSFDDLVRESELADLRKEVEELRALNPIDDIKKALDPTDELRDLDKSLKDDLKDEMLPLGSDLKTPEEEDPVDFGADLLAAQEEIESSKAEERATETAADTAEDVGAVKP